MSKVKFTKPKQSKRKKIQTSQPSSISQLLEHQRRVVQFMLNHRGALVYHGMGSGKTRIAVILVAVLKRPAIIVLPAALKENFLKEIHRAKADVSLYTIVSSQYFLSHDMDCTDKILIVDEAHSLRNADGKISKKVQSCAESAWKVLLLTGTPLVNRPSDIAPLLNMIVKNRIKIPVKTGMFTSRTFTEIPTGEMFSKTFGEDGLNETGKHLWSELFPCMFSYYKTPKTPDFPTMNVETIKVPMSPLQSKIYKAWETRSLTPSMVEMLLSSSKHADLTSLPQFRAYLDGGRRICNMVVGENQTLHAPKFDKMIQLIQQNPGKATVYSHYLDKGINVAEKLLQSHGISNIKFTGQESERKKKEAVELYNTDRVRVFLLSSAGGVGLDLHETSTVHIMDPGWNESDILQAIYRAVRFKSHKTPNAVVKVYRYYCYRENGKTPSADMYLLNLALRKEKTNQQFLTYAIEHSMETRGVGTCLVESL